MAWARCLELIQKCICFEGLHMQLQHIWKHFDSQTKQDAPKAIPLDSRDTSSSLQRGALPPAPEILGLNLQFSNSSCSCTSFFTNSSDKLEKSCKYQFQGYNNSVEKTSQSVIMNLNE
ncbi:hypothetical protein SELMODRAFT_403010 [Selaginella moellendorffii]|uniref:Uncharacterized protein n=1 Tax=Selaginella moellendorffii TaxID=88036 RepID=D8QNR9_SELML|nr:hypothetical protein SELMODRAFT_403010 [Selaginella moellendorffii]